MGVDGQQNQLFGPQRVPLNRLSQWAEKNLTPTDAVVLEMS
jgi:hypothetical protein